MTELQPRKKTRTSSGSSMSSAPSNPMVKQEVEVEQRRALQVSGQAGVAAAATAATDQADNAQGDDPSELTLVLMEWNRFFHCTACSGPLKLPVYKCDAAGHKVCCTCRGSDNPGANWRCSACNVAAASFTLCSDDFQEVIGSIKVACQYKAYGCRRLVSYLKVDEHWRACPDKPCSCSERAAGCDGGFVGSPRTLHDHLAGPLHSWPTSKIEYGKACPLEVTERRRLLVSEGERCVFVLAVAEETADGVTNVSLMCLRSNAAAAAGPHYKAWLWTQAPEDVVTGVVARFDVEIVVPSRESPCEITVREDNLLMLPPRCLRGASRKIVLYVRIEKLKPRLLAPQH